MSSSSDSIASTHKEWWEEQCSTNFCTCSGKVEKIGASAALICSLNWRSK